MCQCKGQQAPAAVVTSYYEFTTNDSYDARKKYLDGDFVVALIFTNQGDVPIQFLFGHAFTLAVKESKIIPIPSGTACADVFTWRMNPSGNNILEITESLLIDLKR